MGRHKTPLICLLLCAVSVAAFAAELGLRRFGGWPNLMAYSRSRGWRLRPSASGVQSQEGRALVAVNSGGFRGPEVPLAKTPGTLRIAVLGDSFTAAVQLPYEKSFCGILDREADSAEPARAVEVLNFGVSGYSTAQEYITLREEVWRYAPDVVILTIVTGNDINDNLPELDSGSYVNGERCRPYFRPTADGLRADNPLEGHGLLPVFCSLNFYARRLALLRVVGSAVFAAVRNGHPEKTIAGSEEGLSDRVYATPADARWGEAWETTEGLIAAIAREVQGRGVKFLAVTLSNPIQVHPDKSHRQRYLSSVGGSDLFYSERRLQTLAKRRGFKLLSLAPLMQAAADHERIYFHGFDNTSPGTGHWNEQGHEFAAKALAKALLRDL